MPENIYLWSTTASDNDDADPAVNWAENMAPGQVNNSARATMAAIARLLADINGTLTTTGSSNAYAVTINSGVTAYTNGILITAKANQTNNSGSVGACTLNMNSLGAKAIKVYTEIGETDPLPSQIKANGTYQFRYDAAANSSAGAFILLNPSPEQRIGDIAIWTTDTAPLWGLFCNGQAVSRTTYSGLFGIISTTYGSGDGSTTFNVPDLRGRAPFGTDDMGASAASRVTFTGSGITGTTLAAAGGFENVTLNTGTMPAHTHSGTADADGDHSHGGSVSGGAHTHSGTTGTESQSHTHSLSVPSGYIGQLGTSSAGAGVTPTSQATSTASQTHTHDFSIASSGPHSHTITASGTHTHNLTINSNGSGAPHQNMPPALMLNFVIRFQ